MSDNKISAQDAVDYLNSVIECDPLAFRAFMCVRIPCNKKLAEHPTAIVDVWSEGFQIGLMGLINGMFSLSEEGTGKIWYTMDDDGNFLTEKRLFTKEDNNNE